ncbi:hypothetical protein RL73_05285 [Liberibacter crescens]|nr:hypothetical protein RL73_05285 [Liberibacter crescens]
MSYNFRNPQFLDQRAFQRVGVQLNAVLLLIDNSEHQCFVHEISPGDICFSCNVFMKLTDFVIIFVEKIGRIEGNIIKVDDTKNAFVATIRALDKDRQKLASKLVWLANKDELKLQDHRQHERIFPRKSDATLILENKKSYPCQVVNISLSGVFLKTELTLQLNSIVQFNGISARVVRSSPEGVAIAFSEVQPKEMLNHFCFY